MMATLLDSLDADPHRLGLFRQPNRCYRGREETTMPKPSSRFVALTALRRRDRERWQSALEAIGRAELPVVFYPEGGSMVDLPQNMALDERAQLAFSPVIGMIEAIESGARLVRPITEEEADEIQAALDDVDTHKTDNYPGYDENLDSGFEANSIGGVESFAEILVNLLSQFTKPKAG